LTQVCAQRPELVAIDTQIAHTSKKVKTLQTKQTAVQRDRADRASSLASLRKSLAETEKAVKRIEGASWLTRTRWLRRPGLSSTQTTSASRRRRKAWRSAKPISTSTASCASRSLWLAFPLPGRPHRKAQASTKAVEERQTVEAKGRDARSLRDTIAGLDDKLETLRYRQRKLATEESDFSQRAATVRSRLRL
jgi:structural maintenance of chromosome 1